MLHNVWHTRAKQALLSESEAHYYYKKRIYISISKYDINFILFGRLINWQLHCLFLAESLFNQKGRSSAGIWQRKRNSPEDR